MNCCIVLPVDRTTPPEHAVSCALQYRKVFPERDIILMSPDVWPGRPDLEAALRPKRVISMSVMAASDPLTRGLDRLSSSFYDSLGEYDYAFVGSFRTFPVYDALDWWMEQGYDYTAAPWMGLFPGQSDSVLWLEKPRGGRGECSLRRIRTCRAFARLATRLWNFSERPVHEDIVLSGGLPSHIRAQLPELRYCPRSEQARFAWDRPLFSYGERPRGTPLSTLFDITRGTLPMFMFDPSSAVENKLLAPGYRTPSSIVLVSSACKEDWDYSAVDEAAPPAGRTVVLFNTCRPYGNNRSVRELVKNSDRVVTFHNDTVEAPYDYAGLAGSSLLFLTTGCIDKRHDTRSLRWRPVAGLEEPVVTFDGEIVDPVGTDVLRGITSGAPDGSAPTAGYMGYKIMRRMFPGVKIVLVNFLGNSHGFRICARHNVEWEQEEYRKDPLVEFMVVDKPEQAAGEKSASGQCPGQQAAGAGEGLPGQSSAG